MNEIQIVIGKVLTLGTTANGNKVATIVITSDDSADLEIPKRVEARFYVAKEGSNVPSPVVARSTPYALRAIINYKDSPMLDSKGVQLLTQKASATVAKGTPMVHQRDELYVLGAEPITAEDWEDCK